MCMEIRVEQRSNVTVVVVDGSVDSADSDLLLRSLDELVGSNQIRLIIDISAMDFIVSMGLGVIVQIHTRLRKAGGFLRLAGAQPFILQLIKTTGLDRLLDIYESVDQALK